MSLWWLSVSETSFESALHIGFQRAKFQSMLVKRSIIVKLPNMREAAFDEI
jgi:hypothetical protein